MSAPLVLQPQNRISLPFQDGGKLYPDNSFLQAIIPQLSSRRWIPSLSKLLTQEYHPCTFTLSAEAPWSSGDECEPPWLSFSHRLRTSEHPFWGQWEGKTNFWIYPSSFPPWKNPHPEGNLLSVIISPCGDLQAAMLSREHQILLVFSASLTHEEAKVSAERILILSFLSKWCQKNLS